MSSAPDTPSDMAASGGSKRIAELERRLAELEGRLAERERQVSELLSKLRQAQSQTYFSSSLEEDGHTSCDEILPGRDREFFDSYRDGIVLRQRDGQLVDANHTFLKMAGVSLEELRRQGSTLLVQVRLPEERPAVTAGPLVDPVEVELDLVLPDGRHLPVGVRHWEHPAPHGTSPCLWTVLRDLSLQKRVESDLRNRIAFEQLVGAISTQFVNLPLASIEAGFADALRVIGEFVGADRSFILLLEGESSLVHDTYEWATPGVVPLEATLQGQRITWLPWFVNELDQYELINVPRVSALPAPAVEERRFLESQGVQSLLMVPIFLDQRRIGFVGFEALLEERAWTADMVTLLRIVGEIIASAVARKQADEALRASEERFRRLVEHAADAFFVHDLEGVIVDVNERACVSLRYPREELLNLPLTVIAPELSSRRLSALWKRILPGGPEKFDVQMNRKDGTTFSAEMHAGVFMQGERRLILASARDVTDRKRVENALRSARDELELRVQERTQELQNMNAVLSRQIAERKAALLALQQSEAKWRSLVQNAPDSIALVSRNGNVEFLNRKLPGVDLLETVSRRLLEAPEERRHPRLQRALDLAFEQSQSDHFEWEVITAAGERTWYAASVGPVRHGTEVSAAIIIASDITRSKEAEALSRRHQQELAHVARLSTLGAMAAEMAHELNQPLAAISFYANGCQLRLDSEPRPNPAIRDALQEISAQAARASGIIYHMRTFAGKRTAARETVRLNDLIHGVLPLAEIEARRHNVNILLDLGETLPQVSVDPLQIEQVLVNLMLNGIEAMDGVPQPRRQLRVRTARGTQGVRISVADHGNGIPSHLAERIYEPFFTTKPRGLGLGLAISRSIVETHGGRLTASSPAEGGTMFMFELPISSGESVHDDGVES